MAANRGFSNLEKKQVRLQERQRQLESKFEEVKIKPDKRRAAQHPSSPSSFYGNIQTVLSEEVDAQTEAQEVLYTQMSEKLPMPDGWYTSQSKGKRAPKKLVRRKAKRRN